MTAPEQGSGARRGGGCPVVCVPGRSVIETAYCARPAGHEGRHAVQWNEDDERKANAPPAPAETATPPSPEEMVATAMRHQKLPMGNPAMCYRMGVEDERARAAAREQELAAEVERLRAIAQAERKLREAERIESRVIHEEEPHAPRHGARLTAARAMVVAARDALEALGVEP